MPHEPLNCDNGPDCEDCYWVEHINANVAQLQQVIDAVGVAELALNKITRIPGELGANLIGVDGEPSPAALTDMADTITTVQRQLRDLRRIVQVEQNDIQKYA